MLKVGVVIDDASDEDPIFDSVFDVASIVLFVSVSVLEIVGTFTPVTVSLPVPLGMRFIFTFVSVPLADIYGCEAVAALDTSR